MIQVITNNLGSGDWVRVINADGELLCDCHSITPFDLVMILQNLGHHAEQVEVTDQQMEEM
jgi:hypothetical protein